MSFDWHFPADVNFNAAAFLRTPELVTGIAIVNSGFYDGTTLLNKPNITGDYHASITFFRDTDEIEVSSDDLATPAPLDGIHRFPAVVPISHVSGFEFEMPLGQTGSVSIDNLLIVEIPEPSSMPLLLICSALYSSRRRKSVPHNRV
jgi:hypothetical protein